MTAPRYVEELELGIRSSAVLTKPVMHSDLQPHAIPQRVAQDQRGRAELERHAQAQHRDIAASFVPDNAEEPRGERKGELADRGTEPDPKATPGNSR